MDWLLLAALLHFVFLPISRPRRGGLDVCRKLERMNLAQVCDWLQYASDQVADTSYTPRLRVEEKREQIFQSCSFQFDLAFSRVTLFHVCF